MDVKKNTVLIVDADPRLQKMMSVTLDSDEFKIVTCGVGRQAARLSISAKPDLVLLDLTLPDMDGKAVITAIRELSQVPIIVLTARNGDDDIVAALNLGANDYVTRPFSSDVLMARIHVALRRSAVCETGVSELCNGALRMDLVKHQVYLHDELIGLTPKEYNLLRYFIVNRGRMLTHKEILREVWGSAHCDDTQYLRVFVGQLRAKIASHRSVPDLIMTEPGVGYRMEFAIMPYELGGCGGMEAKNESEIGVWVGMEPKTHASLCG